MVLTFLNKHRHIGLLVLRIGIGCMFILHGAPKLFGGAEKWTQIGMAMASLGIGFIPAFWGFMAAISEFFGGVCHNPRHRFSTGLYPFDDNHAGCC